MEYRECVALQFWQAIRVWPHSEIFTGRRPVKMLVGELPKPAELLDTLELLTNPTQFLNCVIK